ncbi:MAG: hypothetical protein M4579_004134 [Chaenotheca gracillima]|nr:MAG: hypothetical protein M4579_004134 [Chaenotheca gracillima]
MLSNPNSSLQQRQRQHRRQNSTPTAFTTPKVPILPTTTSSQRHGTHKRGLSVDQRSLQQHPPRDDHTVSTTNPGLQYRQQQILREAQQQRLARPGQFDRQHFPSVYQQQLISAQHPSRQQQSSDQVDVFGQWRKSHRDPSEIAQFRPSAIDENQNLDNIENLPLRSDARRASEFSSNSVNLIPASDFERAQHVVGVPQHNPNKELRSNRGVGDSTQVFAHNEAQLKRKNPPPSNVKIERPVTPPNFGYSGAYPITPASTPFRRFPQTEPSHRSTLINSPSSRDETIKAPRSKNLSSATSCQNIFRPLQPSSHGLPSPPHTAAAMAFHQAHDKLDMAPMPNAADFMNSVQSFDIETRLAEAEQLNASYYSPGSSTLSRSQSQDSWGTSASDVAQMPALFESFDMTSEMQLPGNQAMLPSSSLTGNDDSTNQGALPSALADLNIDASIENTGITSEDIAAYIQGPHPVTGKWICTYPGCTEHDFGRKENIRSHIQTHLGDRQFKCNNCQKCFVRQHDLKRHAKIHSGHKPYDCPCGNRFARMDALTRHKQRNMCIGADKGIIKKTAKRGRPRKQRPDSETRRAKASTTRQRAIAMSTETSSSGFTNASYQPSPAMTYESFSSRDPSPLTMDAQPAFLASDSTVMSQDMFQFTPPTSPMMTNQTFISPQQVRHMQSPVSSMNNSPQMAHAAPAQDLNDGLFGMSSFSSRPTSRDTNPPELDRSSLSPPAMHSFYEFDTSAAFSLQGEMMMHSATKKNGNSNGSGNLGPDMVGELNPSDYLNFDDSDNENEIDPNMARGLFQIQQYNNAMAQLEDQSMMPFPL